MIFEAPILKQDEKLSLDQIEKLDGKKVNLPLLDEPGKTDAKHIIGTCKRLFCKEGVLWGEFELFKFDISVGFSTKPDIDIMETVLVREPDVPLPRNIDYAKD